MGPTGPRSHLPLAGRGRLKRRHGRSRIAGDKRHWPRRPFAPISVGRGCGARPEAHIPGALRSQRELCLARSVDRINTAPTYAVGSRDRFSNGFRGSALISMTSPDIPAAKASLRAAALARRDALDPEWRAQASLRIGERVLALPELDDVVFLASYWPVRSEVDPRPAVDALHARGFRLCLPRIVAGGELSFHDWSPGDPLQSAGFGLSEPFASSPNRFPSTLLVPLAAFDRSGGRIGYGKGYYDRTIRSLEEQVAPKVVGLAFAAQEIDDIPTSDFDEALDLIVTEAEIIRTGVRRN